MLYFSELQGKKVETRHNKTIGKVKDFIFLATDAPLITKVVVQMPRKKTFITSIDSLEEMDDQIIIKNDYQRIDVEEQNELFLVKNLLDKQIIDVKGGKVVRVNDVAIQNKDEGKEYYIAGVDIGFRAVLRWVHLERPMMPLYRAFGMYSHPHFLSWGDIEPLELTQGKVKLKKNIEELESMRPEDLADYLEKTTIRNVNKIVDTLDVKYAADVIADLNVSYQTTLFKRFASEKGAKLVEHLDPDEAIDILLALTREKREEILSLVPEKKKNELRELMKYSKTPIGHLITSEFITISAEDSVGSAFEKIKSTITESHFSAYIYVLNREEELVGLVELAQLIVRPHDTPIYDIMDQDVIVIHLTTPKEIATKKLLRYKLYALPVIEGNKKLVGVVTYDDLVEEIIEKI